MRTTPRLKKKVANTNPSYANMVPGFRLDRSGGVINSNRWSDTCPRCNSNMVLPMRMPGFTLYECLYGPCRHKWRDSYDKHGMTLTPRQWKTRKKKVGNSFGRILV